MKVWSGAIRPGSEQDAPVSKAGRYLVRVILPSGTAHTSVDLGAAQDASAHFDKEMLDRAATGSTNKKSLTTDETSWATIGLAEALRLDSSEPSARTAATEQGLEAALAPPPVDIRVGAVIGNTAPAGRGFEGVWLRLWSDGGTGRWSVVPWQKQLPKSIGGAI